MIFFRKINSDYGARPRRIQQSQNRKISITRYGKKALISSLVLVFPVLLYSQDLSGIWKGVLFQDPGGCYPQYHVELQFSLRNKQAQGKAYDFYDSSKYVKLDFSGVYDSVSRKLTIHEGNVLHFNIPQDCIPCIKSYDLIYRTDGHDEFLTGSWKGHIVGKQRACPPGKITLQKSELSDFNSALEPDDSLMHIQASLPADNRVHEIVKTIRVPASKIMVELYDNAEIDGDSISVFLNGKLVLYHQGLTEKPIRLQFDAVAGKVYELSMFAENLGTIPPNTALLVAHSGKNRYEIFLSSSKEKTATVRFIYAGDR
jgi:hypothetical protein